MERNGQCLKPILILSRQGLDQLRKAQSLNGLQLCGRRIPRVLGGSGYECGGLVGRQFKKFKCRTLPLLLLPGIASYQYGRRPVFLCGFSSSSEVLEKRGGVPGAQFLLYAFCIYCSNGPIRFVEGDDRTDQLASDLTIFPSCRIFEQILNNGGLERCHGRILMSSGSGDYIAHQCLVERQQADPLQDITRLAVCFACPRNARSCAANCVVSLVSHSHMIKQRHPEARRALM